MNFYKHLLFNYRHFLSLALISILFLSCQSKDPFSYFQAESNSIGYKKITNIQEGADFSFGENSILNVQSDDNIELIMPEIKSFPECEIYYSYFDKKNYTLLIVCKGLGESFKRKMIQEKDIKKFDFNEVFSDNKWFIAPINANNVLISTDISDISKAMRRADGKSVVSNEILFELKKELPQQYSEWFITNDKTSMTFLFSPFMKDSSSVLEKVQKNFTSLIFFKESSKKREEKPTLILEGSVDEESNNILDEIKLELSSVEYVQRLANSENYNFSSVDISNINNKFKITIK
jgi:hypothetical protein